ncbi:MAG TPA: YuzB family protein [Bacilli bacterium]
MRPIIEFCTNNSGTERIMKKLEKNPEYDVIEYSCLGNCDQCAVEPFAIVNGTIIAAADPDQLYAKILQAIEQTKDPYADFVFDDE